ncbi:MAG: 3-hydroxybutyryl-CoA dehydrogenase [Chloroflexi bacterium RBG_16_60_22]|nr:MAG: 3-hydroxybutyryl-CoA dehydrogenase [Chloroflexi bacterium RBG_16_60_22]
MRRVGVVGCGLMGGGIAQVCAQSGYAVLVSEINEELLRRGLAGITASLDRAVRKERIGAADRDAAVARIKGTTDTGDFADRDLVIEAAIEDLDIKKRIFGELDKACPENALLATNTSCLSVTEMARATGRPDKVLGLHFFNPVPAMKLLEVIRTAATSQTTLETGKRFGESLGKTLVIVQDTPGFITNRLACPQILNAIRMVESGLATREDIDTAMTLGLNFPMGPLALADFIGLDTVLSIANGIYERLREPQYAAPGLLKEMVAEGRLGRKTGRGFYEYS